MACYQSAWWNGCYGISGYAFGQADSAYASGKHPGTDFGLPEGTPLHSAGNGTVTYAGWDQYLGNVVKITLDNGDKIVLGHLSSFNVSPGPITAGTYIGASGHTGNATGPHLHFEVYPGGSLTASDPVKYIQGQTNSGTSGGSQPVAGVNLDVGGAIQGAAKSITGGAATLSLYVAFFLLGIVILVFALRAMTQPESEASYA